MEIKYFSKITEEKLKDAIWNLLVECDQEFYPSLSSRESSSQTVLSGSNALTPLPYSYFNTMIKQQFICLFDQGQLIAFMTFIHGFEMNQLEKYGMTNYVTTICITHPYRGQGITTKLYDYLFRNLPSTIHLPYVATRTWKQNTRHIQVLKKLGFHEALVLPNHRGEGIDTIYYAKEVK